MTAALLWIGLAATLITGLIILSTVEYGKRLAAEHRVATLETQLTSLEELAQKWWEHAVLWETRATRLNHERAQAAKSEPSERGERS